MHYVGGLEIVSLGGVLCVIHFVSHVVCGIMWYISVVLQTITSNSACEKFNYTYLSGDRYVTGNSPNHTRTEEVIFMRKIIIALLCCMLLCSCSTDNESMVDVGVTGSGELTAPETTQTPLVYDEGYTDIAFGIPCRYVAGEETMEQLACEKGEVQAEWKAPIDGWDMHVVGEFTYIRQVYQNNILLLPLDYGANVYKIIGLDADESDIDCSSCDEKNDGGSDIVN